MVHGFAQAGNMDEGWISIAKGRMNSDQETGAAVISHETRETTPDLN
jgi:hypothetical protein